jgi:dTMP kinase
MSPRTQALLMCGSRAQLVESVITPALARGDVVLCDRFADSTLAYQGYGSGLDLDDLRAVIAFATSHVQPDLTLLLDLPVEDGLARKRRQDSTDPSAWNRFEAAELSFHRRVRAGYQALAAAEPRRWATFDATLPPEPLAERIWQAVADRVIL